MTATLPNCMLEPCVVEQMTPGDEGAVELDRVFSDCRNSVYLSVIAPLFKVGEGYVTVKRCKDGYHLDMSNVPTGHKFKRLKSHFPRSITRARSVTGIVC